MKFDYISPRVPGDLPGICQEKFGHLMVEMGCREDNHHVGSGVGGNPGQLTILMDMRHILGGDLYDTIRINPENLEVIWGYRWFQDKCVRTIRKELNDKFASVAKSDYASRAVALVNAISAPNIGRYIFQHKEQFPEVYQVMLGDPRLEQLSPLNQMLYAYAECQCLALQMDHGDLSGIANVGRILNKLCHEAVLMAVRSQIQIERLVKYNLDEHPEWKNVLNKINKVVDSR